MLGQAAHVLFQHYLRKHPGYKKLADMKMRITQACKEDKKTCPNCNLSVTNLSRHLKKCDGKIDRGRYFAERGSFWEGHFWGAPGQNPTKFDNFKKRN